MTNKDLFINGYLDRISVQFPQSSNDAENRNLAYEIFSIAAILDKPFQEVYDTILVKGSKDGGMDGVWFQDQGDYFIMHVFQCKNKSGMAANEVDKFRNDFRDLFVNANKIGRPNTSDLQPWLDEYKQLSEKGVVVEAKLYFIFNGQKQDVKYANNQAIYDTYNDPGKNFFILDSDDLYDKVANLARTKRREVRFIFHPEQSNISALDIQGLYTYAIQDIRAANFRTRATELCELMVEETKQNGTIDSLFEENIRSYLGIKVRPNKRMNETLQKREEAIYFPFLNNGITIICETLTIPKQPQNDIYLLPVINPQIVNGLQTSRVLYDVYRSNPSLLKDVYVNVRVYETKDKDLIEKITDATNTQTPINYRDKISTKDFNAYTKEVFKNAGINYLTKRGETFSRESNNYKENVESEVVIKYWYATFYEEPQTAKNSIADVLQKIFDASTFETHPLERLFDGHRDSPIYNQMLSAYRIYRYVQQQKRNYNFQYEFLAYADELMSYGIYKSVGTNLTSYTNPAIMEAAYKQALATINTIVINDIASHQAAAKTFSFNAYFKKPKCKVDYNDFEKIVDSDTLIEDLSKIR